MGHNPNPQNPQRQGKDQDPHADQPKGIPAGSTEQGDRQPPRGGQTQTSAPNARQKQGGQDDAPERPGQGAQGHTPSRDMDAQRREPRPDAAGNPEAIDDDETKQPEDESNIHDRGPGM